jgi:hypothetical protein
VNLASSGWCIGKTPERADDLYHRTVKILDHEATAPRRTTC